MKRLSKIFANTYLGLVLALLYLPIVFIIVFSFSNSSIFSFSQGFNFDAYISIFTSSKSSKLLAAVTNTLVLAAVASVISTLIGTFSAVGIFYLKKRPREITLSVNQLPMVNSEIVMAVALMVFFTAFSSIFPQGWTRLIIGHVSFCTPYVVLSILPRLERMDPNMYEAALDLGASPFRALWSVVLPYLTPGIISGFVLAFTLSLDDFIITQINKGETGINTLSTYIYEDARIKGLEPFWFSVFSVFFIVILTLLLVANIKRVKKGETK